MRQLTAQQRTIGEMLGIRPAALLAQMGKENIPGPDGSDSLDPDATDDDGENEIDACPNHLGVECVSGSAEHLEHVEAARDCLNNFLSRKSGGMESHSSAPHGVVFRK
jgi:hypothetical protein